MMTQVRRLAIWMTVLVLVVTAVYISADVSAAFPREPQQNIPTSLRISPADKRADVPVLAQAPNGHLMVVYNQWLTDSPSDSDPYFSVSTNNGQSWSAPQAIATSPGSQSFVTAVYDSNSVAHVVWIDFVQNPPNSVSKVLYVNNQTGGWSSPQTLVQITGPTPIKIVDVVHSTTDRIDVVWDRDDGGTHKYSRLTRSENTWSPTPFNTSGPASQYALPNVTADAGGNLHGVWQQPFTFNTFYTFFNASGSSWSTPIQISTGLVADKTIQSDISFLNGRLYAAMTYKLNPSDEFSPQAVFIRECALTSANSCANINNWGALQNATGQFVGVNGSDPKNIVPNLVALRSGGSRQGMVFLHFHGVTVISPNEITWRVDSCSNWGSSTPLQLTNPNAATPSLRGINPSAQARIIGARVLVHTVYEQVNTAVNPSRQIHYVQSSTNCGQIFLPFISR